ncbi:CRISPR-associated protein Cst2 [Parafrankia irregularis]|uniref:CRISPR-associated protein Cst2 n=1 Tax=Parafrankia irregularis TaxID=795642 RepID=A0A0S4QIU6_9ACTN|nr:MULTISPECIES: type I-B CRISPR-associated protein Cas7/Cst2/DevR [Parafrankia]MBE3205663.1 type I-B CRISPR-associated protein Cas7/Cst2/DevR [Parafrankia sp. CH37]CUU55437.1 CRISPR-associated protein Cst2 [Parafrankia irregularis]
MAFLAGKIVIPVEAGAPNNGRGEATVGRVKKTRIRGGTYPYVSAQAFRRWIRETMVASGTVPSPTVRVGKAQNKAQKATTAADPIRYADDDIFGYMKAGAKEDSPTTVRDSPLMVGTLMSVEKVWLTEDFGVMSRGVAEPVLHAHEFYSADLAAPFLLDVPRIGTFTLPGDGGAGRPNYLTEQDALRMAEAVQAGATAGMFRGVGAVRLPLADRRERVAILLDALAELAGGAKKALHYGDRGAAVLALVPMSGGVNPLGFAISGESDGSGLRVSGDVLRAELAAWEGEWEPPVLIGWRPGFRDDLRKQFEEDMADEIADGSVLLGHPRTILLDLARRVRDGRHDGWFDDPTR